MSAPPDTSCVRTPRRKSLISKDFENRPISSSLVPREGHPSGVPPPLRGGSPSRSKCPPEGGALSPPARPAALPSPLRAGPPRGVLPHTPREQGGGLRPSSAPRLRLWALWPRQGPLRFPGVARVLALAGCGPRQPPPPPLTRPPHPHPASAARRPKAGEGLERNFSKLVVKQGEAAQGPVGMWSKAGQPVGNPCGQAVGSLLSTGCPAGLSTGRAKRASRCP